MPCGPAQKAAGLRTAVETLLRDQQQPAVGS
jgi:hypothetical protein